MVPHDPQFQTILNLWLSMLSGSPEKPPFFPQRNTGGSSPPAPLRFIVIPLTASATPP
jgi:hypothetical protein